MFTHLSPSELSVKQLKDAGLPITDCRGCINLLWILMTQACPKSMYFVNKKFLLSTKSKPRSISFQLCRYQHLKLEIFSKNISFRKPYGWQRVNNKLTFLKREIIHDFFKKKPGKMLQYFRASALTLCQPQDTCVPNRSCREAQPPAVLPGGIGIPKIIAFCRLEGFFQECQNQDLSHVSSGDKNV